MKTRGERLSGSTSATAAAATARRAKFASARAIATEATER